MKKQNKRFALLFLVGVCALVLFCSSCASTAKFDYASAPGCMMRFQAEHQLPPITVVPFRDARPSHKAAEGRERESVLAKLPESRGSFAIGWVPLMPYAWKCRQMPEVKQGSLATLRSFWCDFDRELAEAAMTSMKEAGFFRDVRFAETPEEADTRFLFTGTIHSTRYEGERLTYGLTYLGAPLLWVLGCPTAVSHNHLCVSFRVVDRQEHKVLWRFRYEGEEARTHFLYARVGEDAAMYALLMKQAMNAALHDLKTQVEVAMEHWGKKETGEK